MRKAISNDESTGTVLEQPELSTWDYLRTLAVNPADLDMELSTRAVVIFVSAYPESMRTAFARQKKRIARLADEDLRNDIEATKAAVRLMQTELDRRTLAAKQKRLDDAKRDMERDNLRIERNLLKKLRGGKGFRQ
jgi:hypothetical protein